MQESLKHIAYTIIKDKIIKCEYEPGCQLNEEQLQNEMHMSRTPIRDALSRLEQEGLVTIRSKKGITITPLTIKELNMTFELRQILEDYAIRNYGNLLKEEDLLKFYWLFSSSQTLSEQEYFQYDDAFHMLLMSVVPNQYIARSYDQLVGQTTRFRIMSGHRTQQRLVDTTREHLAILTACLRKDWPLAAEALRAHLVASKASAFEVLMEAERSRPTTK